MKAAKNMWAQEISSGMEVPNRSDRGSQRSLGEKPMAEVVFLLDVDNTLLDSDHLVADIKSKLEREFGAASASRYWTFFAKLRSEHGYADYLGALQLCRTDAGQSRYDNPRLLQMSAFLIDYPFSDRLYPRALDVIDRLNAYGRTVIFSDGDVVFQPRKIQRSGLWDAVSGRVHIYVHKEEMLHAVQHDYPARHYVMVDDKLRVLSAMKKIMQDRLTTVLALQGHYARGIADVTKYTPADLTIERIGDLADFDLRALFEDRVEIERGSEDVGSRARFTAQ